MEVNQKHEREEAAENNHDSEAVKNYGYVGYDLFRAFQIAEAEVVFVGAESFEMLLRRGRIVVFLGRAIESQTFNGGLPSNNFILDPFDLAFRITIDQIIDTRNERVHLAGWQGGKAYRGF